MTMASASTFLFSRELGIHSNFGGNIQFKGVMDRTRLQSLSFSLSPYYLHHDAWTLHLMNNERVPVSRRCTRLNVFICHSILKPSGGNEIQVVKVATEIFTRSYDALKGSPLVPQLAPALGIVAFAVWVLGPLMRFGRIILFHKKDNSWKKSGTNYVLTSYLQPLLLWSGAILLCRALDPVILPSVASQAVKQRLLSFVRSLSTVLAFAYCLSSLIQQTQKFLVEAKDPSDARNMGFEFAGKAVYTAVWMAALALFMELLGFSTQRWLTAGGLGTVLLTLAGREIFTNFLSSIMIHATHPFVQNDWIQTKIEGYEVSGTVERVGWWSPTVIRGDDREAIHIPNHKFTVSVVRNLSQKTHWRIKTHLAISHLDVNKINNIVADMRKVLAKNPQIEQQKLHRRIFLDTIDPESQALMIMVSCFAKTSRFEEYLSVKEAILLDLLRVISHHRARLATPLRTYQKVYGESDVDRVPFAETIFSQTRPAANRSLLLIEPPYKINNDDKTRASQPNEEKDGKAMAAGQTSIFDDDKVDQKISSGQSSDDSGKAKVTTIVSSDDGRLAVGSSDEMFEDEGVLPTQDLGSDEIDKALTTSPPAKQDIPRPSNTLLEDNIVLGVALEGSKRTLPIDEEELALPSTLSEAKGLASLGKDKEDETADMPTPAAPRDPREKGR